MTPEGKVKKEIKAYLDSIGAYYFMPVQSGYGMKTLDFLCCSHGWFIAIEAKAPGKEPTKFQELTIAELQKAGAIVVVAHNAAEVEQAFSGLNYLR